MDVEQRMREAGLPADSLFSRRAALPEPVEELHRWALRTVADTGQPPADADLEERARALGLDLHGALAALAAAELLFVDQALGRVLGGVPFAAGVTTHQVSVADGPTVSANCAVDALGIGAMLGRDTDVRSADPLTAEAVTASQRGDEWTWEPPQAVVFVGSSGARRITDACCPVINFFASGSNADDYRDRHGLTGEVFSMPEAAVGGALVFGGLLAGPLS
ncbi:MAG: alkylmercury lyase family protein [Actinomycetota bacterium]|nr:alkylmercury lyase family protein [Actinomycetota bacterium]